MFLDTLIITQSYTRHSKSGVNHDYQRSKTVAQFKCDNCAGEFRRDLGKIDRRRLSNDYYHVCPNCDSKRFAQTKGVERRRLWNMSADTDLDISKI
jgi:DNA-directed RNA polymerase subunit RPC12/RpoP